MPIHYFSLHVFYYRRGSVGCAPSMTSAIYSRTAITRSLSDITTSQHDSPLWKTRRSGSYLDSKRQSSKV